MLAPESPAHKNKGAHLDKVCPPPILLPGHLLLAKRNFKALKNHQIVLDDLPSYIANSFETCLNTSETTLGGNLK